MVKAGASRPIRRFRTGYVISVYDFGKARSGEIYVTMERLVGSSLRAVLSAGPLETSRAVGLTRQICDGLTAAHRQGVVHRDLKPANVFVSPGTGVSGEHVTLLDFGLARLISDEATESGTLSEVGGTPRYMSPEQAAGHEADHRTDLYALGVVLYELLAGEPPFTAARGPALLLAHINAEPAPLPARDPAHLSRLTLQLLAKEPEQRPQTAHEVFETLDSPGQLRETLTPPRRGGALKTALGLAAAVALVWSVVAVQPEAAPAEAPQGGAAEEPAEPGVAPTDGVPEPDPPTATGPAVAPDMARELRGTASGERAARRELGTTRSVAPARRGKRRFQRTKMPATP